MNCIVKKNLFFLTFFFLVGCSSNSITTTNVACPNVFFATEHKKYIDSYTKPISIDNLSYSAEIDNYAFNSSCLIIDDIMQAELSLLFVVYPDQTEVSEVTLPFYVAILNEINEVVDMQYYLIEGDLKKDPKTKKYIETELTQTVTLEISSQDYKMDSRNTAIVGFMLDKKKLEILN